MFLDLRTCFRSAAVLILVIGVLFFNLMDTGKQSCMAGDGNNHSCCEEQQVLKPGIKGATTTRIAANPTASSSKRPDSNLAHPPSVAKERDANVTVKTNTKEVTLVGEVVDSWCFSSGVMGDGRGEKHKKCARLCISGGVTAGIVTDDGTLYIAAKHQGYKGCAGLLLPYVAQRVKVKAWLAEKGGCKVLKITSVAPVKK